MRVPFELVDCEEFTGATYEGRPFTGTAFELWGETITHECDFVDGERSGLHREYYRTGFLKSETHYYRGKADGLDSDYFEDGRIESIRIYKAGELVEEYRFTRAGVKVGEYRGDTGLARAWRADGSLRQETLLERSYRGKVVEKRFFDHDGKPTVVERDGTWYVAGHALDHQPDAKDIFE